MRQGIGSDPRIGYSFLYAGAGYGGSLLPEGRAGAAAHGARASAHPLAAARARWRRVNERQKQVLVDKIVARFGDDLRGSTFALWGLAFKPNTDDMREAPSRVLIEALLARGRARCAPTTRRRADEAHRTLQSARAIGFADSAVTRLPGADALAIVTEWKEFRSPDFDRSSAAVKRR